MKWCLCTIHDMRAHMFDLRLECMNANELYVSILIPRNFKKWKQIPNDNLMLSLPTASRFMWLYGCIRMCVCVSPINLSISHICEQNNSREVDNAWEGDEADGRRRRRRQQIYINMNRCVKYPLHGECHACPWHKIDTQINMVFNLNVWASVCDCVCL